MIKEIKNVCPLSVAQTQPEKSGNILCEISPFVDSLLKAVTMYE